MGRTKALIDLDGRAMAERVLDALRSVGADPIVLVGGDPAELASLSAPVVPDLHPGEGPVGGVLSALDHLTALSTIDAALILPCDIGQITGNALWPILEAAAGDTNSRVWVAATDRMEPMCALWSLASLDVIRERFTAGERTLHRVISDLPHTTVTVDAEAFHNMNRLQDLRAPDSDR
jgi:molybdopterin-guanine dinucleotide biosynthesis protein A